MPVLRSDARIPSCPDCATLSCLACVALCAAAVAGMSSAKAAAITKLSILGVFTLESPQDRSRRVHKPWLSPRVKLTARRRQKYGAIVRVGGP